VKLPFTGLGESGKLKLTGFSNTENVQLTGNLTTGCKSLPLEACCSDFLLENQG
jgi:hypothetical protein